MSETKRAKREMRDNSVLTAMKQYNTSANQSAVCFSFTSCHLGRRGHRDLAPLPRSLTDSPVQLFKVYKQEPSIQRAADPVK